MKSTFTSIQKSELTGGYKGKQRKVATPGQNKKHFLAGALNSQTGQIIYVDGHRKTTDLFLALLDKLKKQYALAKTSGRSSLSI